MNNLIPMLKPQVPYKPQNGDVLFKGREYLLPYPAGQTWPTLEEGYALLLLEWLHKNPWKAALAAGLTVTPLQESAYTCPYLGYEHFGIVPAGIATKNPEPYREIFDKAYYAGMADFYFAMAKGEAFGDVTVASLWEEPNEFAKILLGNGYTTCNLPSDGYGQTKPGFIQLNNGDLLFVWFREWYNK